MTSFLRLLSYTLKYRGRFVSGVLLSFIVAVLNGLSLTAFVPLFDALGSRMDTFAIQHSEVERDILQRAIEHEYQGDGPGFPQAPAKIQAENALELLNATYENKDYGLNRADHLQLRTIIRWKLRINAAKLEPLDVVYTALIVIIPLYVLKLILLLISVRLIAGTGYMAVRDIRGDLYRSAQRLPLTYFYRERTGLLMSRLINDVEVVGAVISSNLRDSITNFFYLVTHVALLAYLNLTLLLISAFTVPLILSPVLLFTRKIRKSTTKSQELLADLNAHLQENISGLRVIRSFGMEGHERDRFKGVNDKLYWRNFKQQFYLKMGPNLVELTSAIVLIGMMALGGAFVDNVNFTGGEFMAFLVTLLFIIRPIIQLSSMYGKIVQSNAAGVRIFDIIDKKPDVTSPENPVEVRRMKDSLKFTNVEFQYPGTDKKVLHGVNLEVPAGSTVALVGESGGGKSTMMDLLARFFDPDSGSITIDGINIRDFRLEDYRKRIGIVQQEIFLFHGSIRENIAYGNPEYDHKRVETAARLAFAHDFIYELPEGYDTMIGERGYLLSGGQRQRIAIARALLNDPEILILDEATSALDTESERLVQQALDRLFRNRTTFVIAHRLSTIEQADIIFVVSDGKIVDSGKHQELMQRGGLYARLQNISRSENVAS